MNPMLKAQTTASVTHFEPNRRLRMSSLLNRRSPSQGGSLLKLLAAQDLVRL